MAMIIITIALSLFYFGIHSILSATTVPFNIEMYFLAYFDQKLIMIQIIVSKPYHNSETIYSIVSMNFGTVLEHLWYSFVALSKNQ